MRLTSRTNAFGCEIRLAGQHCTSQWRLRSAPSGFAVGATLHSLSIVSSTQHRRLLLVALAVWPVMTGLPAFLVAVVASQVLRRSAHTTQQD
jgi:hypothetical protein